MIRFPRKHIADSVTERIMKVAQELQSNSVNEQSARIEQALAQPVGDIAPIDGIEEAVTSKALLL